MISRLLQHSRAFSSTQARTIRNCMKISKEKFELNIDVHSFNKDEIRVKVRPEFLIVEGKQQYEDKHVFSSRQFRKKFKLPLGTDVDNLQSTLSLEGVLTITAPRSLCDLNVPCERLVQIEDADINREVEVSLIKPEVEQLKPPSQTPGQQT